MDEHTGKLSPGRMGVFSKRQLPRSASLNQDTQQSEMFPHRAAAPRVSRTRCGRPKLAFFSSAFWRTLSGQTATFPIVAFHLPSLPHLRPQTALPTSLVIAIT